LTSGTIPVPSSDAVNPYLLDDVRSDWENLWARDLLYKVVIPATHIASANIPETRPRSPRIKTNVNAKEAKRILPKNPC
jgi:hypothetical protein